MVDVVMELYGPHLTKERHDFFFRSINADGFVQQIVQFLEVDHRDRVRYNRRTRNRACWEHSRHFVVYSILLLQKTESEEDPVVNVRRNAKNFSKQHNTTSVNNYTVVTEVYSDIFHNATESYTKRQRGMNGTNDNNSCKSHNNRTPSHRDDGDVWNKKPRGFLNDSAIPRNVSARRTLLQFQISYQETRNIFGQLTVSRASV